MPVSIKRDPFAGVSAEKPKQGRKARKSSNITPRPKPVLRAPQARVLAVLMPDRLDRPVFDWPLVTRAQLNLLAGFTAVSGSTTRALNGIREGSSSGDAHPGLLALGYVEAIVLDIDGIDEANYRATPAGVAAYRVCLEQNGGALPPLRDARISTNRNQGKGDTHRSKRKKKSGEGVDSTPQGP